MNIRCTFMFLLLAAAAQATKIDTSYAVKIGGIRQWISIRGKDATNPVLLYLHGGPGNSSMSYANRFTNLLQKRFVVVLWDQRDAGKTWEMNHSEVPLTVAQAENDASEMIAYLCHKFSQDKIFLVGHSWGGFLALLMANKLPDKLKACVAAAPMINQLEGERSMLDSMIAKAKRTGNVQAERELLRVHIPFENAEQLYFDRKWASIFSGGKAVSRSFVDRWAKHWMGLYLEGSARNLEKEIPEISCPIHFFQGRKDYATSPVIAERFFRALKAQKKDLIWFTNSGHSLNLTESKKFQESIIAILDQ